ncbi:hypothetical protein ACFSTA_09840 [Ornithinibacillus salinisoli]|uniref:Uncharacterized protein n=1 Tax=Ornithinibacillus salinisoli TaxID=1848459 RepID=A0ABW4VX24_9BACI
MSAAYMPIIILAILMIFLISIATGILNRKSKIFSYVKTQWLLIGYVSVLIISVALYFFIPHESSSGESIAVKDIPDLYMEAGNGTLLDIDSRYIANKWEYNYENDSLTLNAHYMEEANGVSTYIQKRDDSTDKIEVIYYRTPTILAGGIDITDRFPPLDIDLSADVLTYENNDPVDVEFIGYKKEFPFTQHTGEKLEGWMETTYRHRGKEIVLLRIPQDLNMEYEPQMDVQFVEW